MIVTRIEAFGFRSLRYVSQRLGRFHVLVGPNASGKSTFLDVLAFLGDLQRAGLRQAIAGHAALGVPLRAVDPQHLTWMRRGGRFELAVEARVPDEVRERLHNRSARVCRYEVTVDTSEPVRVAAERLWLKPDDDAGPEPARTAFPSPAEPPVRIVADPTKRIPTGWRKVIFRGDRPEHVTFRAEVSRRSIVLRVPADRSVFTHPLPDDELFPVAAGFRQMLADGVQRVAPWGAVLRRPSPPGRSDAYLPDASNLPHVVSAVENQSPERYADWMWHIREALPDIERIAIARRPEDGHRYLVVHYRNELEAPSWLVSDGTLRFLALTLLAYLPNPGGPYLVEEPENGIHPGNVETVLESLSAIHGAQVLLATHSPAVARLVGGDQLLCFARDDRRGTDVVAGSAHPRLRDPSGVVDLGLLLASGVLG